MKQKKDLVPYYIIIVLLFIIVALVVEFNSKSFSFSSNSLWTFLGTLGGAFLGSWLSGKYALEIAEKNINENKLLNAENFRKKITVHKSDFDHIYNNSKLLIEGKNLTEDDLKRTRMNILVHTRNIKENIKLEQVPTDYHFDIELLLGMINKIENISFFRMIYTNEDTFFDKKDATATYQGFKKSLDKIYSELKIQ